MKNFDLSISVIIPARDDFKQLLLVIKGINEQDYLPKEIVVIDSSGNNIISNYVKNYSGLVPINYYKIKSSYPGRARNIGVRKAKEEWISFLDSKTIPKKYWLKYNIDQIIHNSRCNIVFGFTQYQATTFKQKIIRAATFGLIGHETTPGTLMKKKDFIASNEFVENVRAGEDLEWRNRIKNNKFFNIGSNNKITLIYSFLPNKILQVLNKYLYYSFHSAYLNIQRNIKDLYLSIFLIFTAIIIPKWNLLLDGFDKHPFYVPNITKIYIVCLLFILIINNFWRNVYSKNIFSTFFTLCLKIIIFALVFIAIINWEKTFGKWVGFNIWEIPHITKYFLITIAISSLLYRGLYLPIRSKVDKLYLFPFNWFVVGIIGLSIDIIKAPGYLIGAFLAPFFYYWFPIFKDNVSTKEKTHELEIKKILFICPYPEGVQAGQRLKYEQHFEKLYSNGFDIEVSSFMNLSFWKIIYKKGYIISKIRGTMNGYIRRLSNLFQLKNYDVIYIHMWVTPFGTGLFEYFFRQLSKKIVYDIEDNILMLKKSEINPITFFLKSRKKIEYLLKNADQIITSAPDLNDKCISITNKNNCTYICASINTNRFNQYKIHNNKSMPVIGWTGTFSSKQYLDELTPIFKAISKLRKFKLRVIGNFDYYIENLNIEVLKWKKETEVKDLLGIDIGVYPLSDDKDWVLGKSGLKALQYMALGIPTIASNIGNIKNIIVHMKNGFLVNSNQEWIEYLIRLIDDYNLRTSIGRKAINTVHQDYSVDVLSKKYLNVLARL